VSKHETYNGKPAAKGEVRTQCRYRPAYISKEAQLWEHRWWGFNKVGTRGTINKANPMTKVQIFGRWECRNNVFRTTGDGYIVVAGNKYYASTESKHVDLSPTCPG
jgi:hypothetical protein